MTARATEICKICGTPMQPAHTALVLGRHEVHYYSCPECTHFRTEKPYWLEEAYSDAISRADTGLVLRNLLIARQLCCVLHEFFDVHGRYLDTAGGTGLLTRLMRDVGFEFRWEDPNCANVMAAGFEASPDERGFEAVTAFEALEHMEEPMAFVSDCVARSISRTLIFTTELFEGDLPPSNWWYFTHPTGQHISFFSRRCLEEVGRRLQLHFVSTGFLHLLTAKSISERALCKIAAGAEGRLYEKLKIRLPSLTQIDHESMMARLRAGT